MAARNAESCVQSMWALLPSVCNYPSDTTKSFSLIAKTLGDVLHKEPELRCLVRSSLKTLVAQNRKVRGDKMDDKVAGKIMDEEISEFNVAEQRASPLYTAEVAAANLNAVSGYSRKFWPLLFNLFVAAPAERRRDVQLTIAAIASISDKQACKRARKGATLGGSEAEVRKGEGEGTASLGAWLMVEWNSRVRERGREKKVRTLFILEKGGCVRGRGLCVCFQLSDGLVLLRARVFCGGLDFCGEGTGRERENERSHTNTSSTSHASRGVGDYGKRGRPWN